MPQLPIGRHTLGLVADICPVEREDPDPGVLRERSQDARPAPVIPDDREKLDIVLSGGTGPSAAHMVDFGEGPVVVSQVPLGYMHPDCQLFIGPGTLVDLSALEAEVRMLEERGFTSVRDRLFVDPHCGLIPPDAIEREREAGLHEMGLTWENGTTAARADYVWRRAQRVETVTSDYFSIRDVPGALAEAMRGGARGLLVNPHGPCYSLYSGAEHPFTTSDECSVVAGMSRTGVSWSSVSGVIGVCNMLPTTTLPITLRDELAPSEVELRGLVSRGVVSGRFRRVAARHDSSLLKRFVDVERPTEFALGRLDLAVPDSRGARSWDELPAVARDVVAEIEATTGVDVTLVSTGPMIDDVVDLCREGTTSWLA